MKRLGNVIAVGLVALLAAGLVTSASSAGTTGSAAAGKKKKKTCPAGTTKKVVKKKNGKRKVTCVATTPTPTPTPVTPPLASTLSIATSGGCIGGATCTGTGVDFGNRPSGGFGNCNAPPDPDCPNQNFTITNAGPGSSGTPSVSIQNVTVDGGSNSGFQIFANSCTAPLAPGASCVVTVRASDTQNFEYLANLVVSASPGTSVSMSLRVT